MIMEDGITHAYSILDMRQLLIFILNQNLTNDCLLIFVFSPEFTRYDPKIVLF